MMTLLRGFAAVLEASRHDMQIARPLPEAPDPDPCDVVDCGLPAGGKHLLRIATAEIKLSLCEDHAATISRNLNKS